MSSEANTQRKRLKFTLVVREDKDDPSILDIVRVAIEDGIRTPATGTIAVATDPPVSSQAPQRRIAHRDDLATEAREAIEKALAGVPTPTDPKFDPATWAAQLSKVWQVLQAGTAKGVKLTIKTDDITRESDPS